MRRRPSSPAPAGATGFTPSGATEYFDALLRDGVPNVEMHIYARGHHPGDKVGPDEPPATGGLSSMAGMAMGKWSERYLDWFRDLGFLGKPGVETQAAKDVAANLKRVKRDPNWRPKPPATAANAAAPAAAKNALTGRANPPDGPALERGSSGEIARLSDKVLRAERRPGTFAPCSAVSCSSPSWLLPGCAPRPLRPITTRLPSTFSAS